MRRRNSTTDTANESSGDRALIQLQGGAEGRVSATTHPHEIARGIETDAWSGVWAYLRPTSAAPSSRTSRVRSFDSVRAQPAVFVTINRLHPATLSSHSFSHYRRRWSTTRHSPRLVRAPHGSRPRQAAHGVGRHVFQLLAAANCTNGESFGRYSKTPTTEELPTEGSFINVVSSQ